MAREIEVAIGLDCISDVSGCAFDRFLNLLPQTTVFIKRRVDRQFSYCPSELFSEFDDKGLCTAGTRHASAASRERARRGSMS